MKPHDRVSNYFYTFLIYGLDDMVFNVCFFANLKFYRFASSWCFSAASCESFPLLVIWDARISLPARIRYLGMNTE